MQSRTKVRRRVLACARCRKRKLSCDGKVPACTRCLDARVECAGFDSSTQREAPRSIAAFLESYIASLTHPASPPALRTPARPGAAFPSPPASHESEPTSAPGAGKCTHADGLVSLAMQDMTPRFLGVTEKRPLLSCVVKGTQLPSRRGPVGATDLTDLDENHPRSIITATSYLDGIDRKTASGLFNHYLERLITQYPIYHRNHVTAAFNAIFVPMSNPGQVTARDRYIVSIIMAISLSTAARTKQEQANALAYSLVRQALQYIPQVATNDIPGLQALLLLTQYVFLNPSMADVWLLTGLVSQAVIDMGLHQELPNDATISAYQRDMRRRLFWCAWEMEVGVCCILQQPVNLPIRRIHVAFPLEVDDTAITQAGVDLAGRVSKFALRRICLFRLIEAEVISVLWHGEPLPQDCPSIERWKQRCENDILEWQREIYAAAKANKDPSLEERWKEMALYSDIAVPYVFVTLFRPTKLVPSPPTAQILHAFHSTVQVAIGYWKQANADFGRIKYVFHPCHYVFNCAIVFLQALQRYPHQISEHYPWEVIDGYMDRFKDCFSAISERWSAATRVKEEYERLLAPVTQGYLEFLAQKANTQAEALGGSVSNSHPTDTNETIIWTSFNPTATTDATGPSSTVSYNAPYDWHAEFDLDFSTLPGSDQAFVLAAPFDASAV